MDFFDQLSAPKEIRRHFARSPVKLRDLLDEALGADYVMTWEEVR